MKNNFRQSMTWLHTWTGLVVGWVLFFMCVTGSIGYFYIEIDRWMRPELPLAEEQPPPREAVDRAQTFLQSHAATADTWTISLPTGRDDYALAVSWGPGVYVDQQEESRQFRPGTGQFENIPVRSTLGAYGLYTMHWRLHYFPQQTGILIVGLCTMIMLLSLITGIIAHKRIFSDFFTFRPGKGKRSWLDLHNLAAVITLPFLLMITYSGLIFFMEVYMPAGYSFAYDGNKDAFYHDLDSPIIEVPIPEGEAPLMPLASFLDAARPYWGSGLVNRIAVQNPGHDNAVVTLFHAGNNMVRRFSREELHFSGTSGEFIRQESATESAPKTLYSVMFGLHEGVFAGTVLRWVYFISGVLACIMVATGLILWTLKRVSRQVHKNGNSVGFLIVEKLNIGTVAGLPVAIAGLFWANRLLPVGMQNRILWEYHCMFLLWLLLFLYAVCRGGIRGWYGLTCLGTIAYMGLPVLNFFTTDNHLVATVLAGDWALASIDIMFLLTGGFFALSTVTIKKKLNRHSEQIITTGTAESTAGVEIL